MKDSRDRFILNIDSVELPSAADLTNCVAGLGLDQL
jgi:hypothetical protein